MATQTGISVEQYLQTLYEDPAPEYLEGELVPRTMPQFPHSETQARLILVLGPAAKTYGLKLGTELHVRLAENCIRIADVAVFRSRPHEGIPSSPPLIVIEIVSPDDSHSAFVKKLDDYQIWGVAHIWIVDPSLRQLYVYRNRDFRAVKEFRLDEFGILLSSEQVLPEQD